MTMMYNEPVLGVYSSGVKTTTDHKWLGTVYGMCLYEVFAKLAIKMYAEVRNGISERTMTKEEKQRERFAKKADKMLEENKEEI